MSSPFEKVGVKGEKTVQWIGLCGHTVPSCGAPHHWQHVAVVPLDDIVAEHYLILPIKKKNPTTPVVTSLEPARKSGTINVGRSTIVRGLYLVMAANMSVTVERHSLRGFS